MLKQYVYPKVRSVKKHWRSHQSDRTSRRFRSTLHGSSTSSTPHRHHTWQVL